jgi:hypothetical protein
VDWDGKMRCCISFCRVACGEGPSPELAPFEFKVDEVALPDGTTYRGEEVREEGFADCALPVEKLAAGAGVISSLKGTVTIRLPREITTREVELSEDDGRPEIGPEGEVDWPDLYDEAWRPEISEGPFSLEVSRLSRTGSRWKLGYRSACFGEAGEEPSAGAVEVLDSAGRVLKATSRSEEGGGFGGNEGETISYGAAVLEFGEKPARIRWTCATEFDGFEGAFELKDLRMPNRVYTPEIQIKEKPGEPGAAGNGEGEGEGELDSVVE